MTTTAPSEALTPMPRIVRACRREILDRPPVWMMRQAGRYMSEYRAIREKADFLTMCKNPDLAVEVSLQPLAAFGMDAVIMFSDILVPVEAMGMALEFNEKGPHLPTPIRSRAQIDALSIPDPVEKTGFVMQVLRQLRQALAVYPEVGLIGFAGAPWTLATYMVEGGTSRNHTDIMTMLYNEPEALHVLLDKIAKTVILYLNAQIEAGAQVVQLFDTWGGLLPEPLYREFVHPYQQQVLAGLNRSEAPVILYVKGSSHVLEYLPQTGADVISLDGMTTISQARTRIGNDIALQGNLDFNLLFAHPDVLTGHVQAMLKEGGNQGYIFNLSHGIIPQTPVANVKRVVDTVKSSARALATP
jgi:uroporphyrinogen decarboxylase